MTNTHYNYLLRSGTVNSVSDIGRLEGVTQQRASQILSLLLLAPEIQETLLTLPIQLHGERGLPTEKMIHIAKEMDFEKQWDRFLSSNRLVGPVV